MVLSNMLLKFDNKYEMDGIKRLFAIHYGGIIIWSEILQLVSMYDNLQEPF